MDISQLQNILNHSWCAETAYGEWRNNVPSLNQCAVTALIVQDHFGGDLLRCPMTNGDRHYYNRLPDGTEVDLTQDQFSFIEAQPNKEVAFVYQRKDLLSSINTRTRYLLLSLLIQKNHTFNSKG